MADTRIKDLAVNFFSPRLKEPEQLVYDGDDATVQDIKVLDYPGLTNISTGGKNWGSGWTVVVVELNVVIGQSLKKGDIIGTHRGSLAANLELVNSYEFVSDQERAQLLLNVIQTWAGKENITCFCSGEGSLENFDWKKWSETPESERSETPLGWKYPSDCGRCRVTREILTGILGDSEFPFIESHGNRRYSINLKKLRVYAEDGPEILISKETEEREEAAKRAAKMHEEKVTEALNGAEVSEVVRRQLVTFVSGNGFLGTPKVVSKDLVIISGGRQEYGNTGGIGMFSQARVWYKGHTDLKEWQWRDRYSPSHDQPSLHINGIGNVEVETKGSTVEIKVELMNSQHGHRFTTFTFEDKDIPLSPTLTIEEQSSFTERLQTEMDKVLGRMMELWPKKNPMLTSKGYMPYRQPSIKERVINATLGIAAFITEEQIDHDREDRQVRFELYVIKHGGEAKFIHEDHGYEKREGSRVIGIVDLTPAKIVISTQEGQKTFTLS